MSEMSSECEDASSILNARNYQLEAFEKAKKENTIVYLETGSGKTLIAIMLLRHYACTIRKPSSFIAVFLVPTVVIVKQQAEAIKSLTDLIVGMYWGDMGVDFWDLKTWKQEVAKHEVFVMTPQILLDCLRHSFLKLEMITVLIMDECHHARGKDAYACIMKEFYHRHLNSSSSSLPRIFGMTASPIKSKCAPTEDSYRVKILELEAIMHSKVYTTASESVVAQFVPQSSYVLKYYQQAVIPDAIDRIFGDRLTQLEAKHESSINEMNLDDSDAISLRKKLSKRSKTLTFCFEELGVFFAFEAAKVLACPENEFLRSEGYWNSLKVLQNFTSDAYYLLFHLINDGLAIKEEVKNDNIVCEHLTGKVTCLCDILLEYRSISDIRCIVFVTRVITAVVLESFLSSFLGKNCNWKTKFIAGSHSGIQFQAPSERNDIIKEFRDGKVNVIVATSVLEEGVDVQSCNLVIRFDHSTTMRSFIQSRGRARARDSTYVVMINSDDHKTSSRMKEYLAGGEKMRKISLLNGDVPNANLVTKLNDDHCYIVESTRAIATIDSSVATIHLYCSRLPSDKYFKPCPRFIIDKVDQVCTLHLPKSSPVLQVVVRGNLRIIKQKACLEACKQLHAAGALTDNLVPDIVVEEEIAKANSSKLSEVDSPIYFPIELARNDQPQSQTIYFCYLLKFTRSFQFEHFASDIVLAIGSQIVSDFPTWDFDLDVDGGSISVQLLYVGEIHLSSELVTVSKLFQVTLFRILTNNNFEEIEKTVNNILPEDFVGTDYLLLPSKNEKICWESVFSVLSSSRNVWKYHHDCDYFVQTKYASVCKCMLKDSIFYTPHNGKVYCVTGIIENLNGRSLMVRKGKGSKMYKEYYMERYGITLLHDDEFLLRGRVMFPLQNFLRSRVSTLEDEGSKHAYNDSPSAYVELPPELCSIIMHPISISILYTFSFLPSVMHRIESLLNAARLKKLHLDNCVHNLVIPTTKVLEAITSKKCEEKFHLESLETIGDSFLKYATCRFLFTTHQNNHEGLLSLKKDKIVSNPALCALACSHNLLGFIRNEPFDHKQWLIPGDASSHVLREESLSETEKIYVRGRRTLKEKRIADVVEALIGAYLLAGGEAAALVFMRWIGLEVDLSPIPPNADHLRLPLERFINLPRLQSLLNYTFNDPYLLLEALTHGSYMVPDLPKCYQRLEFLGDAVLDYLITMHMSNKYPGLSPGLITDLRSASVNNTCYALSAIKAGLHIHVLHASNLLHGQIQDSLSNLQEMEASFGWESDTSVPKVLGDVIESLAGAIYVDSGFNKVVVYKCIVPLLEPLVTPATLRRHPSRELHELCQKHCFKYGKLEEPGGAGGRVSVTVEVNAGGEAFTCTSASSDKKTATKLASKQILDEMRLRLPKLFAA